MAETKSTCPYCGVGCGVIIDHDGCRITGVHGDPDHPANFGRLCTKGSTLHLTTQKQNRLLHPELRTSRSSPRLRVSWDTALDAAAQRFAEIIREDGPDAVGFYVSGQLLTEDYYVFNKLAKGLVGTNNIDTNSRLCMSSAVSAYKQTLGVDAPPCSYEDFDHTDCILIAGANPAYAHPVAYRRIEAARAQRPDLRIIVADPRRTDTAAGADLHLPILPGTDIWLFNAILHVLIWDGHVDQDWIDKHTEGFEALREHVRSVTPAIAARVCGVPEKDIIIAAQWWGKAQAPMSLWCQGLNQSHHGTHNGTALIALSLARGKIGLPGCGPFSLTGQPNAMGGREVGGMANLLSAHRDLGNPEERAEVAALWGIDSVPANPGLTAVDLFEAAREGKVRALWIACTNPAHSMPQQSLIREALERCEFVVLQEAFATTETASYADLLLPATTWGEKEGTVTNSERRITRVRVALPPPGEAHHDWEIARDFGFRLGTAIGRPASAAMFAYQKPEDIFLEHADSTRGRDLDISGLTYARLEDLGPQQWPVQQSTGIGTVRLYSDGQFPTGSGRARFVIPGKTLTAEKTDAHYPIHLTSGRLRDQWHGMSRTGQSARLYSHVDEPRIDLARTDMERREIREGDLVRVSSRRGNIIVRAHGAEEIRPGQAFMAMHWGKNSLNSAGVNELTLNTQDPFSRQPEFKHTAIQIEKTDLPWQTTLMCSTGTGEAAEDEILRRMSALHPVLERFDYASVFLAGRDHPVLILRLAHTHPIPQEWLAELDELLDLTDTYCLAYSDAKRSIHKKAVIREGVLTGLRLSGETAAEGWLRELMVTGSQAHELRQWLLAPLSHPPHAHATQGRIVCNCLNVSEEQIRTAIATGASLEDLQASLRCGTSCGSCLPELRRMLEDAGGGRSAQARHIS